MKRIAIIVAVVVAIAVLGVFVKMRLNAAAATGKTQYKTAKVARGTVKKTVSATGVLQPWTTVSVKSKAGGLIYAMLVDVGDRVKKGQVLAKIDPSDTKLQVDQAKADIDTADARIRQSDQQWLLQKQQSQLAVDQARMQLQAAQASMDAARSRLVTAQQQNQAQPDLTSATIASAQANLDSARKQLLEMQQATNPQEQASAQSAYDQAKANADQASSNLDRQKRLLAKGYVAQQVVDQAQASYDVSRAQVDNAKRKLDTLKDEQDAVVQAQVARVQQAQAQLKQAQAGRVDLLVRKGAVTEARAAVSQQQKAVDVAAKAVNLALANVRTNDIRAADIATARASKARAMASYVNADKTLVQTTVTSPSEGVVLKKNVEQGTIISSALSFAATGNDILLLGDVTRMYVDVTVDETDIANVEEGQSVDITFDAYQGVPFEGKVIRVDPQAVVESNVTNIHVRVELDNSDVKFQLLKPGMNATCEFVKAKKDDVVAVPNEAVHDDDQGKFVEVTTGGKQAPPDPKTGLAADPGTLVDCKVEKRRINTQQDGLEGNDTTEITSGLKEGETIVLQKIEPVVQQAGGAIGGGMPGGPRGGGGGRGR